MDFDGYTIILDYLKAAGSAILALVIIFLVLCLGWFIVWKLFLSRFKFFRELLAHRNDNSSSSDDSKTKSKGRKGRRRD